MSSVATSDYISQVIQDEGKQLDQRAKHGELGLRQNYSNPDKADLACRCSNFFAFNYYDDDLRQRALRRALVYGQGSPADLRRASTSDGVRPTSRF